MKRASKIIYWIATLWMSLGMTATGITQVFAVKAEGDFMKHLGYPPYFLKIIGIWKLLGVIAVLIPKYPLLKEWTYAGFFFVMTGAIFSHIATGTLNDVFPSLLLLTLTLLSYFFRPAERRITPVKP